MHMRHMHIDIIIMLFTVSFFMNAVTSFLRIDGLKPSVDDVIVALIIDFVKN